MQNRYTGDIGDYVKFGLLRALAEGRRIGVAWYLFPDEGHNSDGRHVAYLGDQQRWRSHDPDLFDLLGRLVGDGRRSVTSIEESGILPSTVFASHPLSAPGLTATARHKWRERWFDEVQSSLQNCDLVFADPDNGLCQDAAFRPACVTDWKRLPLREAYALAKDRTAILYHHNTRRPGGHTKEIAYWINQLGNGTLALQWRAYSVRTFFVVNPAPDLHERLKSFARRWRPNAVLHE